MDNNFLQSMRIIFIGILMGPLLFLGVVMMLQQGHPRTLMGAESPLLYVVILAATAGVISSNMLYRMRVPGIKSLPENTSKLAAWRTLFIIKIAIIEGVTLLTIVSLMLNEGDIYLYIAVALLGLQTLNFPTANTIQNDCEIQ